MESQRTTASGDAKRPLVGQGMLFLPGVGDVWLVWSDEGLVVLALPSRAPGEVEADLADRGLSPPPLADVPAQYAEPLLAYAQGADIDPAMLPVDLRGTAFQVRVWQALRRIPRGAVRSYAGIATDVGSPRGMRAVGMANAANPVAIVVPCHRVVESKFRLGGYTGGLDIKRHLLELEGVRVDAGKVIPGQLELWDRLEEP